MPPISPDWIHVLYRVAKKSFSKKSDVTLITQRFLIKKHRRHSLQFSFKYGVTNFVSNWPFVGLAQRDGLQLVQGHPSLQHFVPSHVGRSFLATLCNDEFLLTVLLPPSTALLTVKKIGKLRNSFQCIHLLVCPGCYWRTSNMPNGS